jgi:hypothetical protein
MNDKNVIDFEEKKKKKRLTNSESVKDGDELEIVVRVIDQVFDPQPPGSGDPGKVSENAWFFAEELKDAYDELLEDWKVDDYKVVVVNTPAGEKNLAHDQLGIIIVGAEKRLEDQLKLEIKRVKKRVWQEIFDQLYSLFEVNKPEGWEEGEGGKK